jgi:hypothetical protein
VKFEQVILFLIKRVLTHFENTPNTNNSKDNKILSKTDYLKSLIIYEKYMEISVIFLLIFKLVDIVVNGGNDYCLKLILKWKEPFIFLVYVYSITWQVKFVKIFGKFVFDSKAKLSSSIILCKENIWL